MLTSIVIPTYNRAGMVRLAVESALEQCRGKPREVVVAVDGSTDGTLETLAEYGEGIRVLALEHGERSRARNAGMEAARGRYVLFLDDDDLLLPGGLDRLEQAMEQAPEEVALVYGKPRYIKVDPTNPLLTRLPPSLGCSGWVLPQLLQGNFLQPGTILARREHLLAIGGFDPAWPPLEDYQLWLRVAGRWPIIYEDTEVAEIRLHGSNSSRDIARSGRMTDKVQEQCLLSDACRDFARRRPREEQPRLRGELAGLCLDLARRRWWEGDNHASRRACIQATRLDARTMRDVARELWRVWVPVHRPAWMKRRRDGFGRD